MPDTLIDGDFSRAQPVGPRKYEFPFRMNGDRITALFEEEYWQTMATYTPQELSIEHPTEKGFYLIAETQPVEFIARVGRFIRTYSRIPAQQTVHSSQFITKPPLSSFSSTLTELVADYSTDGVVGPVLEYGTSLYIGGNPYTKKTSLSTLASAAGGTFTLTYGANTTAALAYNASDGTINTALNGLASVISDGLTFSATNGLAGANPILSLALTAGSTVTAVTMNGASLTPSSATTIFSRVNSSVSQSLYIGARAAITAHGFDTGEHLAAYSPSETLMVSLPPTLWTSIDANTVAFWNRGQASLSSTLFGQETDAVASYTEGTALCRIKRVTDFYLPGVTPGIASADDIPLPVYQGAPATLVAAILAGATSINYEVGELNQWRESPIFARTITTINPSTL
jgi:hypothetical protein